jgi:thioredoxin-related protein
MEECPFCQKMRRNVFTQKPIIDYFRQHFLNFEVDVESYEGLFFVGLINKIICQQ